MRIQAEGVDIDPHAEHGHHVVHQLRQRTEVVFGGWREGGGKVGPQVGLHLLEAGAEAGRRRRCVAGVGRRLARREVRHSLQAPGERLET